MATATVHTSKIAYPVMETKYREEKEVTLKLTEEEAGHLRNLLSWYVSGVCPNLRRIENALHKAGIKSGSNKAVGGVPAGNLVRYDEMEPAKSYSDFVNPAPFPTYNPSKF